jgi:hypothetical protein
MKRVSHLAKTFGPNPELQKRFSVSPLPKNRVEEKAYLDTV